MSRLDKLIAIAGPATLRSPSSLMKWASQTAPMSALHDMLGKKNGFYAFESALHVFGDGSPDGERGIQEWNSDALWREQYECIPTSAVFFAEDVFGSQFCIVSGSISTFDPETGAFEYLAADLEEWAAAILDDYRVLTGFPIAHDWQSAYGSLRQGQRLVPTTPFVLGGEFAVSNVHPLEAVKGMHVRADIARQIRDLPDGASVSLKVAD